MKRNNEYNGVNFKNIVINSKNVKKGDLFVAIKGAAHDGHEFVEDAIKNGAGLCIVQEDAWISNTKSIGNVPIISVKDTHDELSRIAYEFYGRPSERMKTIGITGTNGKTTIGFLLDEIFSGLGYRTGLIGTVIYKINDKVIEADRTTPDALTLNSYLGEMADGKTDFAVMEVSSHSIAQKRTGHVFYDNAVFTNLTPEHLDYHKTMEEYFDAKKRIFDNMKKGGLAIINNDDPRSDDLKKYIKADVLTFGIDKKSDIQAVNIVYSIEETKFTVKYPGGKVDITTSLIGKHNISNLLAGISVCYSQKINLKEVKGLIKKFSAPKGRLDPVNMGQDFKVFVDYAHTEDALSKVLSALKPYVTSRLITVFGCGGDRDRLKRPKMGKTATDLSSFTIITSDNPRSENPTAITDEIEQGITCPKKKYKVILDRKEAIKEALTMARKSDIILIAGKGHETYQIIGKNKIDFDDKKVTEELILNLKNKK